MALNHLRKRVRDFLGCYLPLPYYYGRQFRRILSLLEVSQGWSREQMIAYKLERLQSLVRHAELHVPYYRRLFAAEGIRADDIKSFADFAQLPILTKEQLGQHLDELKSDRFESYQPILTRTSGTTGTTTTLYRSAYQEAFRAAVTWRSLRQAGVDFGCRKLTLLPPKRYEGDMPLQTFDRIENARVINSYFILAGKKREVIDAIREHAPEVIVTAPTLLFLLADYMVEHDMEPIEVPLIESFGEKLYDYMLPMLRRSFPGRLIDYYANRENTIAAWGSGDETFTEVSEYCHLEVPGAEASGIADHCGNLITTSLHNYAMPLIRYNSGDIVRWRGFEDDRSPCPSLELLGGRGKDLLLTHDGLFALFPFAILRKNQFFKIKRCQIEQISLDKVVARVVVSPDYQMDQDEQVLIRLFEQALLSNFEVEVEYIGEDTFAKLGKFRPVISRFAMEHLRR